MGQHCYIDTMGQHGYIDTMGQHCYIARWVMGQHTKEQTPDSLAQTQLHCLLHQFNADPINIQFCNPRYTVYR